MSSSYILWIGFCHTGHIALCIDLSVCICFILHSCSIVSTVGVNLIGLKPNR